MVVGVQGGKGWLYCRTTISSSCSRLLEQWQWLWVVVMEAATFSCCGGLKVPSLLGFVKISEWWPGGVDYAENGGSSGLIFDHIGLWLTLFPSPAGYGNT